MTPGDQSGTKEEEEEGGGSGGVSLCVKGVGNVFLKKIRK